MPNASIRKCTCHNAQQDALHGPGMRVHNPTRKVNGSRCTVCRNQVTSQPAEKNKDK